MKGLGAWLEGGKDPRNWNYRYELAPTGKSVTHIAAAPISDQGEVGACVGFTCLDVMNMSMFSRNRLRVHGSQRYLTNGRGDAFYSLATQLDEWPEAWPPQDSGSSVLAGAKALKKLGYIERYSWAFTFSDFLAAVEQQPVMVGTPWTTDMSDPDRSGVVCVTGKLAGGHAYSVRGVSYTKELLRCRNHWTADWGWKGEFFVTFKDMEWLLDKQGEVLIPEWGRK